MMHSLRILSFTMTAIAARLTARIKRLVTLLPIGRMKNNAIMQMPVTTRNIRSRRAIRWSKMSSSHFFIMECILLSEG